MPADIAVENFKPGTADRLGTGGQDLRRRNPRLVCCSISGFGQDGPSRGRLGSCDARVARLDAARGDG